MFETFSDADVILIAAGALVTVVTLVMVCARIVRRVRAEKLHDRTRHDACTWIDALATAISYADLIISQPDCSDFYRLQLNNARTQLKEFVRKRDLFNEQGAKTNEWYLLGNNALSTAKALTTTSEDASAFIHQAKLAMQALKSAQAKLAAYVAPPELQVDTSGVQAQLGVAERKFGEHRFEECRSIVARLDQMVSVCEEGARLALVIESVLAKYGVDSWQAERARTASLQRKSAVRWLNPAEAEHTRAQLTATRLKLSDFSNSPDCGDLLEDES